MKNSDQLILAIDPGYDRLGVAVIKQEKGALSLIYSDCIVTDRKLDHSKRLNVVGESISKLIEKWSPEALAIEELFFSKNQKTALLVSQALGVIIYEAEKAHVEVFYYKPVEVKVAVTGYGKSDKDHVTTMVTRLIKMEKRHRHDDEYDAIAVGLTHLASNRKRLPIN